MYSVTTTLFKFLSRLRTPTSKKCSHEFHPKGKLRRFGNHPKKQWKPPKKHGKPPKKLGYTNNSTELLKGHIEPPAEASAIKEIQTKFQYVSIETALNTIHSNYKRLYDGIRKLQNNALSLAESLEIVDEVNSLLQAVGDASNKPVKNKLESVLKKDIGFTKLKQISDVHLQIR
ncbi:hypothetical protein NQ318_021969 [Aromia moschata]|uniref:Uncharacterized protein n=1 Tax=Aromia moschata TaxID=1265417 RepID=A0AAV8Z607_9CUCU|nr:hypothetical protein NQ318_021969 [Aromia moschata]